MSSQYFRFNVLHVDRRRSPLLERLLARSEARSVRSDWRSEAFALIAPGEPMPAVAAAALCAERGAVEAAWVCVATPVHYLAEMTRVRLPQDGILSLPPSAAQALAADFNAVWAGAGTRLSALQSGQLLCLFDRPLSITMRDPADVLGQSIEEYLPLGKDVAALRQLISETEMWLYGHGVNSARGGAGERAVNGLWFWGGGAPLRSLPKLHGWVGGDDVFFNSFGAKQPPCSGGNSVIVAAGTPGGDPWHDIEARWIRPAIGELRRGRLSRLEISALDRRFTLTSMGSRRFWRRPKPWWEVLE